MLFFAASTYVSRFGDSPEFKPYLPFIDAESIRAVKPHAVHREFVRQIQLEYKDSKLEFAGFTIKKNTNIYGVVFASHSLFGLETFLKTAWKVNRVNGDANFDIDGDIHIQTSLFGERRTKLEAFSNDLASRILNGEIVNNQLAYAYTIRSGFLPKHATPVIRDLKERGAIAYTGHCLVSWDAIKLEKHVNFAPVIRGSDDSITH